MRKADKVSSAIYIKVVSDYVAPMESAAGFRKTRKDWFQRWEGDCLWRISCYLRQERGRDEGWFSITVCVGFRSLAEFLAPCPVCPVTDIKSPCAMGTDLGHLRPPYNLHEWRVLPSTDVTWLGGEAVRELRDYGLPFFEQYGSLDKALKAWEHGTVYNLGSRVHFYRAAAYWLRGERQRAVDLIEQRVQELDDDYRQHGRRTDFNERVRFDNFLLFLKTHE
jgi:hypothetical protein